MAYYGTERIDNFFEHHGIQGQKWGRRRWQNPDGSLTPEGKIRYSKYSYGDSKSTGEKKRKQNDDDDVIVKKGTNISRIILRDWAEKEKNAKGRAYVSYSKDDVEAYKGIAQSITDTLGEELYKQLMYTSTSDLKSPGRSKRVKYFVDMMKNDPVANAEMHKATKLNLKNIVALNALLPTRLKNLDKEKNANKAYDKMNYLLVNNETLRNRYFDKLRKEGYNAVVDDADIKAKVSKNPLIVFDREKSLKLESINSIKKKAVNSK